LAAYQARLNHQERKAERAERERERSAAFRQRAYEKQLDAYSELSVALQNLMADAIGRLTNELGTTHGKVPMDPARRFQLRADLMATWQPFAVVRQRWAIFTPKAVAEAIGRFENVLMAITAPPGPALASYDSDLVNHVDPSVPLATAHGNAVKAMRDSLGIEPLAEATLQAIGAPAGQEQTSLPARPAKPPSR
jgi:hypothetical protein